jgi:hypothetical protein
VTIKDPVSWGREREETNRAAIKGWGPTVRLLLLRSAPIAGTGGFLLLTEKVLRLLQ